MISHLSNVTQRGVYQAVKFLVTWACFMSRVNVISREVSSNLIGQKKKKTVKLIPSFWEAKFVTVCLFILFTNLWVSSAAVNDYQKAKNINEHLHKVQEGLDRAQKLLKQSKKRDYYKILGLKRTASKKEILKSYRKLAVKWHPDQYKGDDKKKAEKMFIDIAAAKEVLTDPEKRAKYDNGEDPLDPEQQGGGHHHWQQGGFPFGGGFGEGFQFKFHFN